MSRRSEWTLFSNAKTQNIAISALFTVILALFFIAIGSIKYVSGDEKSCAKYSNEKEKEILWCPSTWAVTTFITAGLLVVAGLQAALLRGQLQLMRDQKEAARRSFIVANRPRIIVRNIRLPEKITPGWPINIAFLTFNIGGSNGILNGVEASAVLLHNNTTAIPGNLVLSRLSYESDIVKDGEFIAFNVRTNLTLNEAENDEFSTGQRRLFWIGYIRYADEVGNLRQTGFVRVYNRETSRFDVVDDPEYEYSY